jgi:hypothetical protein
MVLNRPWSFMQWHFSYNQMMRFSTAIASVVILIVSAVRVGYAAALPVGDITLTAPSEYQVFQRQTDKQGKITIQGRLTNPSQSIEYRVIELPQEGSPGSKWQSIAHGPNVTDFRYDTPTAAGGWYRVELRVLENSVVVASHTVEHVGVGEVFVIAGQSNSTNYGNPKQKPTSGKVSTFDGHAWRIADDPQPGTQDHSTGGSFAPAFGDALVARYHVPVAIASVGYGATSVREWLPKGDRMKQLPTTGKHVTQVGPNEWESTGQLYDGLIERIAQLGPHGFRAILWHQGESDAGQARAGYPADRQITGNQYHDWLKHIIAESHIQAGWDFPWFVARATYHSEKDAADEEFRSAQKSLWDDHSALPGPDTDQLTAEYRNGVHFNAKGLQEHGKLWAEKVAAYLDPMLSQNATPPAAR